MEETYLGQIRHEGRWLDYARGTEEASRTWQEQEPTDRRVVDWIDKDRVLIPARCAEYSSAKVGMCNAPLDVHDNCPEAWAHGDHLADR